jgi:hypothetical protein
VSKPAKKRIRKPITLTIPPDIRKIAQKVADRRGDSLSQLITNVLGDEIYRVRHDESMEIANTIAQAVRDYLTIPHFLTTSYRKHIRRTLGEYLMYPLDDEQIRDAAEEALGLLDKYESKPKELHLSLILASMSHLKSLFDEGYSTAGHPPNHKANSRKDHLSQDIPKDPDSSAEAALKQTAAARCSRKAKV